MNNLIRNPAIVWRHEARREEELLKAQDLGEDISESGTVILVADGTMHQLNLLGGEIWQLCDGSRNMDAIVRKLAAEYDVDPAEVTMDVGSFIEDLLQRGWLQNG